MAQFARPVSDRTNPANLTGTFADIDEVTPSDADYVYGENGSDVTFEVNLSAVTDPGVHTGHIVRFRVAQADSDETTPAPTTGGANATYDVRLMEGQGVYSSLLDQAAPEAGSFQEVVLNVSESGASNITDYSALHLQFVFKGSGGNPNNRRTVAVSWAELEVPDAGSPPLALTGAVTTSSTTNNASLSLKAAVSSAVSTLSTLAGALVLSASLTASATTASTVSATHLFDQDAKALIDAVEGATTMTTAEKDAVDKLARSLKTNNLWDKLITLYPMVGSVYDSQKWNMKDPQDTDAAHRLVTLTEGTGTQSNSIDGWQLTADNNAGNGAYLHGFLKSSDIQPTNAQRFAAGQFFYINSDMGSDPNGGFMAGWWNGNGDKVLQFRPYAVVHPNTYIKYTTSAIQVPNPSGSGAGFYAMFTENANLAKAWYNGSVFGSQAQAITTYDNTLDRIFPIHGLHNNGELVTPIASHFYDPDGHTARHAFAAQSNTDWSEAEVSTMETIVSDYVSELGRVYSYNTQVSSSINVSSTVAGSMVSFGNLVGAVSGSSVTSGDVSLLNTPIVGAVSTSSVVSADVVSIESIGGSVSTNSSVVGETLVGIELSGGVSALSVLTGALDISGTVLQLTGALNGSSVLGGNVVQSYALSASLSPASSVSGGLNVLAQLGAASSTGSLTSGNLSSDQYDSDAQAFIDAVEGGGDTLTTTQKDAIDFLVKGLKANGTWSRYSAIYPMVGGTASAHKWNLKDPRDLDAAFRLTYYGTLGHTSNGIVGNQSGVASWAITHFNVQTHWTVTNSTVDGLWGFYNPDGTSVSRASNSAEMAVNIGLGGNLAYMQMDWNNTVADIIWWDSTYVSETVDGPDYYGVIKSVAGSTKYFKNGVQLGPALVQDQATMPNIPVGLLAGPTNADGSTIYSSSWSERTCATAVIGTGVFTDQEVADDSRVIQDYNAKLGRSAPYTGNITGSIAGQSSLSGNIDSVAGNVQLTASISPNSLLTGDITTKEQADGSISTSTLLSAEISISEQLTGGINTSSTLAGEISPLQAITAAINPSTTTAGSIVQYSEVSASITPSSLVSATADLSMDVSASVSTSSTVSGNIDSGSQLSLSGAVGTASILAGETQSLAELSAAVSTSSLVSGNVDTGSELALTGSVSTLSSLVGETTSLAQLTAGIAPSSLVSGSAESLFAADGSVSTVSAVSAEAQVLSQIAVSVSTSSTLSGNIDTGALLSLTAAITPSSSVSGDIISDISIVGAITTDATTAAALDQLTSLTGAVNASTTLSGDIDTGALLSLSGAASTSSALSASLESLAQLSASLSTGSTTAGDAFALVQLAASVPTDSSIVGQMQQLSPITGSVSASSAVVGNVDTDSILALTGASAASSSVSGDIDITSFILQASGAIAASSSLSADITLSVDLTATTTGQATTSAELGVAYPLTGSIFGGSALSGQTGQSGALSGAISCSSVVSGGINTIVAVDGAIVAYSVLTAQTKAHATLTGAVSTSTSCFVYVIAPGKIMVYTGTSWIEFAPKVWDGAQWKTAVVKKWDGAAWVLVNSLI